MARVKDRLTNTKPGNAIVLKSRHVFLLKRVLTAIPHHRLILDDHTHRSSAHRRAGCSRKSSAGSTKIFASSSPTYRYVIPLWGMPQGSRKLGVPSLFLPSKRRDADDSLDIVLEVHSIAPPNPRSWFLGEQVIEGMLMLNHSCRVSVLNLQRRWETFVDDSS
jgi:hypothetical protein